MNSLLCMQCSNVIPAGKYKLLEAGMYDADAPCLLMEETAAHVKAMGMVGTCFGHAGDGHLHCLLPIRVDDTPEYLARLQMIQERLMDRTLRAGGTCTKEHGMGMGK